MTFTKHVLSPKWHWGIDEMLLFLDVAIGGSEVGTKPPEIPGQSTTSSQLQHTGA